MNILAANDQENLAHTLQAGAAAKNAGLKSLGAKTPGNKAPKTPFKVPLNDENAIFKVEKLVMQTKGKGNENLLMTTKKGSKLEANAFVTPAGPRSRAPLGMKTTNAKAKAFQNPAPLSGSAKTQKLSPRLRRPKVKVHQPEVQDEQEDDVPEVEYMPPKEIPLPDAEVDGVPSNWNFSMLKGKNFMRGYNDVYHNPVEEDGRTRGEREFEETLTRQRKERDDKMDKMFEDMMAKDEAEAKRYLGLDAPPKQEAPKPSLRAPLQKNLTGPSTIKAKSAAAALSPSPKPRYTAPTAVAKSRIPTSLIASRKPAKPVINPSATRHATANAASKSTIGYAQGRSVVGTARKPLSNITRPTSVSNDITRSTAPSSIHNRSASSGSVAAKPRSSFSRSVSASTDATLVAPSHEETYRTAEDVEREMQLRLLEDSDEEDVNAWINSFNNQLGGDPLDEEFEDFQLQLPTGL